MPNPITDEILATLDAKLFALKGDKVDADTKTAAAAAANAAATAAVNAATEATASQVAADAKATQDLKDFQLFLDSVEAPPAPTPDPVVTVVAK